MSKEAVEVLREEIPRLKACWDNHHINNFDYKDLYDIGVACEKALLALERLDRLEKWRSDEYEDCFNTINCEGFPKKVLKYGYGEKVKFLEKLNEVLQNGK